MNYSKSISDQSNITEKFVLNIFFNHSIKGAPDCPDFCDLDYDPVCGSDGKTYPSICNLKKASCKSNNTEISVVHPGGCEFESKKNYGKSIQIIVKTFG